MDKFLICQPLGGLNDLLCQIGMCIKYAEKYNRTLIIDTKSFSDLSDHFFNYFQVKDGIKFIQYSLDITSLHKHPLFPKDISLACNLSNVVPRCININLDFDDKFLLHRAYGGGIDSLYALQYFTLSPYLSTIITERKKHIGKYDAVLIRNTDYKTDYQPLLNEIVKIKQDTTLFLFTDDFNVQLYAKTLQFRKLIVNENLYKSRNPNVPIMTTSRADRSIKPKMINDEVICDLFLASLAIYIYPSYINRLIHSNIPLMFMSGFVKLAIELNKDTKLRDTLLNMST